VAQIIIEWLGAESRATANRLILAQVQANGDAVDFKGLDGIKEALNVTLGSAFKATSRVITNDDGLQYLDTLKESSDSNKYLLSPDPANPMGMRLNAGATSVPLVVVPNAVMPTPSEGAAAGQIPFIVGDLNEGIVYWDREWMSIAESAIASIGDFNAFEQDLTIYRAIEREDVTLRDTEAFVHGYITKA
jgi:HK97 family phage major capsid protein